MIIFEKCSQLLFTFCNNLREGHDGDDDCHNGDARRDGRGDGLEEGRLLKLFALLKKC